MTMVKKHNKEIYKAIKRMLKMFKECCIVAATGIGKSNIITELLKEFNLNALIIVPTNSLIDEWNHIYEEYNTQYFSIVTYSYFALHYKDLYGFDAYIFDEAHHMGSNNWGRAISDFKSKLVDELFIGLSADINRYFDKNINKVANKFFNKNHVVYGFNQKEAIELGILPKAKYVCAVYNAEEELEKRKHLKLSNELIGRLNYSIQNCKSIKAILRENICRYNPKGIVFVDSIKNIDNGIKLIKEAFPNESVYYMHSKLGKSTNKNTLNQFRQAKSGFIVSVGMLSEGNHIKGINTIIMLRKTSSPSLYTQQIGRGLAANCKNTIIFDFVRNDLSVENMLSRVNILSKIQEDEEDEEEKISNVEGHFEPKVSSQFIVEDYATDILNVLESIDIYRYEMDKLWSKEEDKILREKYPTMGGKVCKFLINKTSVQCHHRAEYLNIKYNKRLPNPWSEEEDKILRENYPTMGGKVCKLLNNKSEVQCRQRASILKIKHSKTQLPWTEDEDKILRENYPTMGGKVSELLNGRDADTCRRRAQSLKIVFTGDLWTEEEDDIIRNYYPDIGTDVCEIELLKKKNRSRISCARRANKLGVYSRKRPDSNLS